MLSQPKGGEMIPRVGFGLELGFGLGLGFGLRLGWDLGSVLVDPIAEPPQRWGDDPKGGNPTGSSARSREFHRIGIGIGFPVKNPGFLCLLQ